MAQPRPRTPGSERGARRREEILDAAVRLFSRRGFNGTGIIGVAKEVGITHAGLLHHFGTKQQLLLDVVARRDARQAPLIERMRALRGLEALRAVELLARDAVDDELDTRLFGVLTSENLHEDAPLNGYFRDRYALLRSFVAAAVRSGQADGEIRPDADPDGVGAEVTAFVAGAQVQWLLEPGATDLVAVHRAYLDRLVGDLRRA